MPFKFEPSFVSDGSSSNWKRMSLRIQLRERWPADSGSCIITFSGRLPVRLWKARQGIPQDSSIARDKVSIFVPSREIKWNRRLSSSIRWVFCTRWNTCFTVQDQAQYQKNECHLLPCIYLLLYIYFINMQQPRMPGIMKSWKLILGLIWFQMDNYLIGNSTRYTYLCVNVKYITRDKTSWTYLECTLSSSFFSIFLPFLFLSESVTAATLQLWIEQRTNSAIGCKSACKSSIDNAHRSRIITREEPPMSIFDRQFDTFSPVSRDVLKSIERSAAIKRHWTRFKNLQGTARV